MGLCKCPKKKVTNLFCFEHRVNVCEHCLVANHSKCVVQSYLKWLQDSDYNSICTLCNNALSEAACVRLLCYDVFHWSCINAYAKKLPGTTAPSGYQCPKCRTGIFPPPNMASPVAEQLQKYLSQVNWARTSLGLPLIDEPPDTNNDSNHRSFENHIDQNSSYNSMQDLDSTMDDNSFEHFMPDSVPPKYSEPSHHPSQEIPAEYSHSHTQDHGDSHSEGHGHSHSEGHGHSHSEGHGHSHSEGHGHIHGEGHGHNHVNHGQNHSQLKGPTDCAVNLEHISTFIAGNQDYSNNRKVYDTTKDYTQIQNKYLDHDENKYQRRPALQWFSRWFSFKDDKKGRRPPPATYKKFLLIIVIGVIGFITVVTIFSQLGRASADNDPFLDPMANPNIRVGND